MVDWTGELARTHAARLVAVQEVRVQQLDAQLWPLLTSLERIEQRIASLERQVQALQQTQRATREQKPKPPARDRTT
jgi:prefoldin subunit 5